MHSFPSVTSSSEVLKNNDDEDPRDKQNVLGDEPSHAMPGQGLLQNFSLELTSAQICLDEHLPTRVAN